LDAGDPAGDLRQALKYISKPLAGEARASRLMWLELVEAMAGRRRAQTWGCWYGTRLTDPADADDPDDPPDGDDTTIERTGHVLIWTRDRDIDISDVMSAYWFGWSQVGAARWRCNYVLATVAARQDLEDGG
jgi:hypothetical protein